MIDGELLDYLLAAAISLSGYGHLDAPSLPPIQQLPHDKIVRAVCPDDPSDCQGLVAYFDRTRYRILLDAALDLEQASDNSFLVHELVHVLQYRKRGARIFSSCAATLQTEQEAYRVQNAYLKREGQFLRVGGALHFLSCDTRATPPWKP